MKQELSNEVPLDTHQVMQNVHLLIADDNRDTLEILQYRIDMQGWKGTYVTNATAIIEAMNGSPEQGHFDGIIADVNYFSDQLGPRLTGLTAAREVRKVRPNIPIIFITAYSNSIIREEARRVQAEVVPKPFDLDNLFSRIYHMIYFHRLGQSKRSDGTDRRMNSVNMTQHRRRSSDALIGTSSTVQSVLEDIRSNAK